MRQIDSGSSGITTTFNALGQRAYRENSSAFSASYSYDPSGKYLGRLAETPAFGVCFLPAAYCDRLCPR